MPGIVVVATDAEQNHRSHGKMAGTGGTNVKKDASNWRYVSLAGFLGLVAVDAAVVFGLVAVVTAVVLGLVAAGAHVAAADA